MKLVYINCDNSSVVEAQVLTLLKYYVAGMDFEAVTLLQGYSGADERLALEKKLKGFEKHVIWFKRWPGYTYFDGLALHSIGIVLDKLELDAGTIIHARGELYGAIVQEYVIRRRCQAKLLVDIRGVGFEEVEKYYSLNTFLRKNKRKLFFKSFDKVKAAAVTAVSDAFREYLISSHGFNASNVCVHPNIAGQQFTFDSDLRKKMRSELGFEEKQLIAICSSGGGAAWQKDKELIDPLVRLGVKVINLSSGNVVAPGVINKMVRFDDVPSYLAAADMAVLWRDDNVVNNVASPSKLSEFACMGLWIIHNGSVRIASDYIHEAKAGLIIKQPAEITERIIKTFIGYDHNEYSIRGRALFGVENVAGSYLHTYQKVLKGLPVGINDHVSSTVSNL